MATSQNKPASTSAQAGKQPSKELPSGPPSDQLALPLTDDERKASRRQLATLHPGNRLRLMLGQPLLPLEPESGQSHSST